MKQDIRDHAFENISEEKAAALEDTLWWLQGRKYIIRNYLQAAIKTKKIEKIMDVGCGSGGNFDVLAEFAKVVAVERSHPLVMRARARGIAEAVYEKDFFDLPDYDKIDLFTLFDVLEHIEYDFEFFKKIKQIAPPNHMLLLSVPACQFLYSDHDRLLHHYRRYSRKTLHALLRDNGYEITRSSYFMFFLFPFALFSRFKEKVMRLFKKKQTSVNVGEVPNWLNRILTKILDMESRFSRHFSFPIGLWIFVLAKSTTPDHRMHTGPDPRG
ncbi:MAG: methyltransferase domain-containing protein [Candidatus Aminicenantes bacterium]|nr:methyltransferase domain-containing protein [Candidatus Aminicenantes bacterium]NIM79896.1 methyltransferase domain-containing protein [Candidatus Aminicenantes bacterium]NIN19233.1 methyltransferase domain-containing protein [Candidatus Aminicenantes bacterium]NIN43138.1 methyltransferase domain-containing protein [Candidatus Aminicenantes bacterium]NIN85875.1 methyltransferase domain-containing protein [Candidatus Aminicenantes bacterium]